jgi:glycosyltransferase involved in cell wall biosynthesis
MKDHRNPYLFDQLTKQIKALGINTFVHVLGMLPRLDQILLMRGARVVVQPSLYEGWSTVLEDSRALGKTVVASDFPVHLEQAIPGAIYFRSGNSQECAQAIEASLHLPFLDIPRGSHEKTVLTFARDFMHIVEKTIGNA